MAPRVLSLDVSAASTGWAFKPARRGKIKFGLIKTNSKLCEAERLMYFREQLQILLREFKPTHVVLEDLYAGRNVNTMKVLAKFAGVAEEVCMSERQIEPYIIHTNTVKAYLKARDKKAVYNFMIDILDWDEEKTTFGKDNDKTDAIAQLCCYCEQILECYKFRFEKDYGFLYEV
jgi:Holliday junction resolvasome RuvABC endonuclease subunit